MKFTFIYGCLVVLHWGFHGTQADLKFTKVGCNSSAIGTCTGIYCNVDKAGKLSFGCSLIRDVNEVNVSYFQLH